jgi:hypothetical protein
MASLLEYVKGDTECFSSPDVEKQLGVLGQALRLPSLAGPRSLGCSPGKGPRRPALEAGANALTTPKPPIAYITSLRVCCVRGAAMPAVKRTRAMIIAVSQAQI